MDVLANLLELKKQIESDFEDAKRDFEEDLASVDRLIKRRKDRNGTAEDDETRLLRRVFQRPSNGNGLPGRPGTTVDATREAIRAGGEHFNLFKIMDIISHQHPGHDYTKKAVSSVLGRLAKQGQIRVLRPGAGHQPAVYAIGEKFPPARV